MYCFDFILFLFFQQSSYTAHQNSSKIMKQFLYVAFFFVNRVLNRLNGITKENNNNLKVDNVIEADAGTYTCKSENNTEIVPESVKVVIIEIFYLEFHQQVHKLDSQKSDKLHDILLLLHRLPILLQRPANNG
ncbi:hypothetical protein B566_EDAN017127 [Ephemera danica]|nr:hypothetical protein B566_EDAN017127 [Ephemera danica]